MIINDEDYDIDELATEYGSMRNFMMDLNCDRTVIFNNDPSLYQIDYFDGSQFREIYTIDLPFTEYEDHGICFADIRKIGGIGAVNPISSILEIYDNVEKWCSVHPLALGFAFMFPEHFKTKERRQRIYRVLKRKGLKLKSGYFADALGYKFPESIDSDLDEIMDDIENTK